MCIIICSDDKGLPPHDFKFSSIKTVIFLILYMLNFILFFLWFKIYLLNSKGGFMIMTSFWLKSIFVCSVWHLLITPCNIDYALPQSLQSIYKGKQNFILITVLRLTITLWKQNIYSRTETDPIAPGTMIRESPAGSELLKPDIRSKNDSSISKARSSKDVGIRLVYIPKHIFQWMH